MTMQSNVSHSHAIQAWWMWSHSAERKCQQMIFPCPQGIVQLCIIMLIRVVVGCWWEEVALIVMACDSTNVLCWHTFTVCSSPFSPAPCFPRASSAFYTKDCLPWYPLPHQRPGLSQSLTSYSDNYNQVLPPPIPTKAFLLHIPHTLAANFHRHFWERQKLGALLIPLLLHFIIWP